MEHGEEESEHMSECSRTREMEAHAVSQSQPFGGESQTVVATNEVQSHAAGGEQKPEHILGALLNVSRAQVKTLAQQLQAARTEALNFQKQAEEASHKLECAEQSHRRVVEGLELRLQSESSARRVAETALAKRDCWLSSECSRLEALLAEQSQELPKLSNKRSTVTFPLAPTRMKENSKSDVGPAEEAQVAMIFSKLDACVAALEVTAQLQERAAAAARSLTSAPETCLPVDRPGTTTQMVPLVAVADKSPTPGRNDVQEDQQDACPQYHRARASASHVAATPEAWRSPATSYHVLRTPDSAESCIDGQCARASNLSAWDPSTEFGESVSVGLSFVDDAKTPTESPCVERSTMQTVEVSRLSREEEEEAEEASLREIRRRLQRKRKELREKSLELKRTRRSCKLAKAELKREMRKKQECCKEEQHLAVMMQTTLQKMEQAHTKIVQDLRRDKETLSSQTDELQTRLSVFKRMSVELENCIDERDVSDTSLADMLDDTDGLVQSVEAALQQLSLGVAHALEATQAVETIGIELAESQHERRILQGKLEEAETTLEDEREAFAQSLERARARSGEQEREVERVTRALTEQQGLTRTKMQEAISEKRQLEAELAHVADRVAAVEEELKGAQIVAQKAKDDAVVLAEEKRAVEAELAMERKQCESTRMAEQEAETERVRLAGELSVLDRAMRELQDALRGHVTDATACSFTIAAADDALRSLESAVHSLGLEATSVTDQYGMKVAEAEREQTVLKDKLLEAERAMEEQQEPLEMARLLAVEVEGQVEMVSRELQGHLLSSQAKIDAAVSEKLLLEKTNLLMTERLRAMYAELKDAQDVVQHANESSLTAAGEKEGLLMEVETLRTQKHTAEVEVKQLASDLDQAKRQGTTAVDALASSQAEQTRLRDELARSKRTNEEHETMMSAREAADTDASRTLESVALMLHSIETKVEQLSQSVVVRVEAKQSEAQKAERERVKLEERLKEVEKAWDRERELVAAREEKGNLHSIELRAKLEQVMRARTEEQKALRESEGELVASRERERDLAATVNRLENELQHVAEEGRKALDTVRSLEERAAAAEEVLHEERLQREVEDTHRRQVEAQALKASEIQRTEEKERTKGEVTSMLRSVEHTIVTREAEVDSRLCALDEIVRYLEAGLDLLAQSVEQDASTTSGVVQGLMRALEAEQMDGVHAQLKLKVLTAQLVDAEGSCRDLNAGLTDADSTVAQIEEELVRVVRNETLMSERLSELMGRDRAREVDTAALEQKLELSMGETEKREAEGKRLMEAVGHCNDVVWTLEASLAEAMRVVSVSRVEDFERVQAVRDQMAALHQDLEWCRTALLEVSEYIIAQERCHFDAKRREQETLGRTVETLQARVGELEQAVQESEKKVQFAESRRVEAEEWCARLQEEGRRSENLLQGAQRSLSELQDRNARQDDLLREAAERVSELTEETLRAKQASAALAREVADAQWAVHEREARAHDAVEAASQSRGEQRALTMLLAEEQTRLALVQTGLENSQQRETALQGELEQSREELISVRREIWGLQAELRGAQKRVKELDEEVARLVREGEEREVDLRRALQAAQQRVKEAEEEVERGQLERDEMEGEIDELQIENRKLELKVVEVGEEGQLALVRAYEEMTAWKSEVQEMMERAAALEGKSRAGQGRATELESDVSNLEGRMLQAVNLEREMAQSRMREWRERYGEFEREVDEKMATLEEAGDAVLAALNVVVSELHDGGQDRRERRESHGTAPQDRARSEVGVVVLEMDSMVQRLERVLLQVAVCLDQDMKTRVLAVTALGEHLQSVREGWEERERRLVESEANARTELDRTRSRSTARRQAAELSLSSSSSGSKVDEVEVLRLTVDNLEDELAKVLEERKACERSLHKLTEAAAERGQHLADAWVSHDAERRRAERLDRELSDARARVEELEGDGHQVTLEVEKAVAEFERELDKAKRGQDRALTALQATKQERRALRQQVQELQREIRARQMQVADFGVQLGRLSVEREEMASDLARLRSDLTNSQMQVVRLEEAEASCRRLLRMREAEANAAQQGCVRLHEVVQQTMVASHDMRRVPGDIRGGGALSPPTSDSSQKADRTVGLSLLTPSSSARSPPVTPAASSRVVLGTLDPQTLTARNDRQSHAAKELKGLQDEVEWLRGKLERRDLRIEQLQSRERSSRDIAATVGAEAARLRGQVHDEMQRLRRERNHLREENRRLRRSEPGSALTLRGC